MRHNQTLTAKQLQEEARKAIENAEGERQASVARKLGITRSAVNMALNTNVPSHYASTFGRIIEALTGYEIERSTVYRVKKKGK